MGGTYDWGKPIAANDTIRTMNVTSFTTPMGTFRGSYMSSSSGKSSAGFAVTESMYFLTIGFGQWSGYPILNDPETTAYLGKFGALLGSNGPGSSGPGSNGSNGTFGGLPVGVVVAVAVVALAAIGVGVIVMRRRAKPALASV
jgi:hypothetical protein